MLQHPANHLKSPTHSEWSAAFDVKVTYLLLELHILTVNLPIDL